VKSYLLKKLEDEEFKKAIAEAINKRVDVPKLSEKTEFRLIRALVEAVVEYIKVI
jgi:hypothetical protein